MKITVSNSTTTKAYSLTNVAPYRPYMTVSNLTGWFLPLTTKTKSGYNFKVTKGTNTYRAMEYTSASGSASYYSTSDSPGNMSSTTALTRASTSDTSYLTCVSTSGTTYLTRASTSDTSYGTCASTSGTTYLTRASTSATSYGTRASTSSTTYYTRVSTSGTSYQTRASTSAATYYTRVSTSGTNYGTRASTSDAKYATRASTSATVYSTRVSTSGTNYGTRSSTSTTIYQTRASTSGNKTDYHTTAINNLSLTISCDQEVFAVRPSYNSTAITSRGSVAQYIGTSDFGLSWSQLTSSRITVANTAGFIGLSKSTYSQTINRVGTKETRGVIAKGNSSLLSLPSNIQGILPPISTFTLPYSSMSSYSYVNTYQKSINYSAWFMSYSYINSTTGVNISYYTYSGTSIYPQIYFKYDSIGTTYLTRASTSNTVYGTRASTSGTTYLTRASTSTTIYQTRASTSAATYYTRASTSGTTYLTRASTSNASYATRASTSNTVYLTRASTSDIKYGTKVSTSTTIYQTRASTSGTNYGTRSSTSGTTYLTRASTSDTVYGTRASTSATSYLTRISTSGYSGVSSSSSSMNTWE